MTTETTHLTSVLLRWENGKYKGAQVSNTLWFYDSTGAVIGLKDLDPKALDLTVEQTCKTAIESVYTP